MNGAHDFGGPAADDLPLDFDAWAELSARLMKRGPEEREAILREGGIEPEAWRRCDEHHTASVVDDVVCDRFDRRERYGARCAEELARRGQRTEAARQEAAATAGGPTVEPASAPPPAAGGGTDVPTFLQPSPPPAAQRAPPGLAETMETADFPSFIKRAAVDAVPFGDTPSAAFVAAASAPRAPRPSGIGDTIGTGVDLMSLVRETLPFGQKGEVQASPGADGLPGGRAAGTFPRLPLQAYASLCAVLSVYPARSAEILGKYGIKGNDSRLALDADWQARFAAHPDTREEWARLVARYREGLMQGDHQGGR